LGGSFNNYSGSADGDNIVKVNPDGTIKIAPDFAVAGTVRNIIPFTRRITT